MQVWLCSDHHCGEDRFEILQRPFKTQREMIDTLVKNHNSLVSPDDLVYFGGDICYQKTPEFLPEVERFNGKKVLIRGNHDRVFTDEQLSKYFFDIIPDGEGIDLTFGGIDCHLTHYPTRGKESRFNLVGHVHSAFKYQLNMLNIGVDTNHFYPMNSDRIPFFFKAIQEFYDDDAWVAYNEINRQYVGIRGKKGSYFK